MLFENDHPVVRYMKKRRLYGFIGTTIFAILMAVILKGGDYEKRPEKLYGRMARTAGEGVSTANTTHKASTVAGTETSRREGAKSISRTNAGSSPSAIGDKLSAPKPVVQKKVPQKKAISIEGGQFKKGPYLQAEMKRERQKEAIEDEIKRLRTEFDTFKKENLSETNPNTPSFRLETRHGVVGQRSQTGMAR
jgi:hypothetical protein